MPLRIRKPPNTTPDIRGKFPLPSLLRSHTECCPKVSAANDQQTYLLLSSRLYCRFRNPTGSTAKGSSRTIPPVGTFTPPRRTFLIFTFSIIKPILAEIKGFLSLFRVFYTFECTIIPSVTPSHIHKSTYLHVNLRQNGVKFGVNSGVSFFRINPRFSACSSHVLPAPYRHGYIPS